MAEDVRNRRKELVKQHLEVIDKHTDNWSNGALALHTPEGRLKVADLIIDMVRAETHAALIELAQV